MILHGTVARFYYDWDYMLYQCALRSSPFRLYEDENESRIMGCSTSVVSGLHMSKRIEN